jgi:uncharacterized protein
MAGPWGLSVVAYAVIAAVAVGAATAARRSAWSTSPRWAMGAERAHALSLVGGLVVAAVTIAATRWLVQKTTWARTLHRELRPAVMHHGPGALVLLGASSALAEELLFRGVLAPAVGALASSVAFGLLHQLRGSARWAWVAWATLLGLLFALLFLATGSLLGPIVGHAAINVVNLRRLRDVSVTEPRARKLGGLLGPR